MLRLACLGTSLGLLAALSACGAEAVRVDPAPGPQSVQTSPTEAGEPRNPTADRTGPLPDGGAASCVESYSPSALVGRAFAFDGVVLKVGPSVSDRGGEADLGLPGVTFEVQEWFSGGQTDTVTVDLQPPTVGADEPTDPGYAYGIGSRLLVSGEARWGGSPLQEPIGWGCEFSRYYDPMTATLWREALGS